MLDPYLRKWGLAPAGELIVTHTSRLLPVRYNGQPAMLKVTDDADEKHGHLLMR
jgi:streptomycin 6-kinase